MIQANKINDLYEIFSHLLSYGFYKKYPFFAIEERLIQSELVKSLEEDKSDKYLYRHHLVRIFDDVYGLDQSRCEILSSTSISLWISEAYIRLFYKYHKSFEYLFLLINLETMYNLYNIYHEMDFSQLFDLFESKQKDFKLLNALLAKRGLNIKKLSLLTSISEHTLYNYSKDNDNLYNACFDNIYTIAQTLDVSDRVFVKRLNNDIDYSIYDFDKKDTNYHWLLATYYLAYFYKFNIDKYGITNNQTLISKDDYIKVILDFSEIKDIDNIDKTHLVIYMNNDDKSIYESLLKYGFIDVFIITEESIIKIENNGKITRKFIPNYVRSRLTSKAKRVK